MQNVNLLLWISSSTASSYSSWRKISVVCVVRLIEINVRSIAFNFALALFLLLACVAGKPALADEKQQKYEFNVSETTLGAALEAIARITGQNVLYPFGLVNMGGINEVSGNLTPNEALSMLLEHTGLSGQLTERGVIVIAATEKISDVERELQMDTRSKKAKMSLLRGAAAIAIGTSGVSAQDTATVDEEDEYIETVVVTGVRGKPRSAIESPTPIDVFSEDDLLHIPQPGGLFQQLRYLVPSLNFPQRAGGGTATFIASAGLRGLNPDQTLVLVNGKRRHKTSLLNTSTGLFSGAAGVDLNMIPNAAIARIEVLRDGAAAQYGSDAIAGVINIILKEDTETGFVTGTRGQNFDRNDGEFLNLGFNTGFSIGDEGFVSLSFDYREREGSERANPVPIPTEPGSGFRFFPDVDNGDGTFSVDPRESVVNRLVRNYGNYPARLYSFAANMGYDFGDVSFYSFATYTDRSSTLFFTFRRPRDTRNNGEIFPNGFIPEEEIREDDYEIVAGFRGETSGFDWDLSAGLGRNEADWFNPLGANASLGELSPTSFYLGAFNVEEKYIQLDVTKAYDVSMGELQVSFGSQFRQEEFEILEGDPEGTITFDDPSVILPNDPRGAQGFPAFGPDDVSSASRDNFGVYGELGWQLSEDLFLSAAGRFESLTGGAGDELIYKVAGRYDPLEWLGLRGSFNTGFRAPSVQQLGFRGSRGQFVDLDNDGVAESIVLRQTLPADDAAAAALGASPLQPETSENFSLGFTLDPGHGLTLTFDAYQIKVKDRIVLSAQFNRGEGLAALGGGTIGDQVSALLDAAGIASTVEGANYFTNAIDTRSRGFDIVATYQYETDFGDLIFSGAFNYNEVVIQNIDPNPEELSGLILANGEPLQQFDRARLGTYTDEFPETKLVLSANYQYEGFSLVSRATRFGSFTNVANNPAADSFNSAKWIFDLQASYSFDSGFSIVAGSNNIFNTYPDVVRPEGVFGGGQYDGQSPFGFTGGTWFVRGEFRW